MNIDRLRQLPSHVVASLENKQIPLINYILTFFAIVILREYLECYSQIQNGMDSPYPLWTVTYQNALAYMVLMFPIGMIIHYVARVTLADVFRVMIPCMMLLILTPLLDLILTAGAGVDISYLQPYMNIDVLSNYLTFWGHYEGVSTGMRIEIAIMLSTCFIYFREKGCSVLRSLVATWACYSWIFIFGCTPIIVTSVLDMIDKGSQHFAGPFVIMRAFLLLLFGLSFWVSYLLNRSVFITLMKDIRFLRIAYYELSLLFGVAIAMSMQNATIPYVIANYPYIVTDVLMLMIALFFACTFCLMVNNIYDVKIDKVSNPNRPLAAGTIDPGFYSAIAYAMMGLALFYASVVGTRSIMIIGLVMSTYYIYSATPLRIKRLPVLSKIVISVNSAALILLGFLVVQQKTLGFPVAILWIYFIGVTLAANCIDLKDVAGDKAEGIMTLPILLGNKTAKLIIGAAGFGLCLSYIVVLKNMLLLPVLGLIGAVFFYLVNKPVYEDRKVLLLCDAGLLLMCGYLFVNAWIGV